MGSVSKRTQADIEDYIKLNSKDGELTRSLMDIGEELGYSNATVQRALKTLEAQGLIEVTPSKRQYEPNTIFYKGTKTEIDALLQEGVQLVKEIEDVMEQVQSISLRLNEFVEGAKDTIANLQDRARIQGAIQNNNITTDIPQMGVVDRNTEHSE